MQFILFSLTSLLLVFRLTANPVKVVKNEKPYYKPLENPNYLFGDIIVPKDGHKMLRNALSADDFLWPNGVVPIQIHSDLDSQRDLIIAALNHFHEETCIRFKQRTDEPDFINIIADEGCYSSIGRTGGEQSISLGDGCLCKGTIIHELMHALGFYHEQNRSDRDEYVYVIYEKILEKARHEFNKLPAEANRLFTDYDYESIMQYSSNAFSVDGSDTMIPTKSGVVLTHPCYKGGLSSFDKLKISKLYKCQ